MRFDILTLFPEIVEGPLGESILKRAVSKKLIEINIINIRDFTRDKHRTADDRPFGGGPGMVMKAEPVFKAVESCQQEKSRIILMSPAGKQLTQAMAKEMVRSSEHFIIICGHYEGIDHRVIEGISPELISIGPYVLTNGALAACVFVDVLSRLKPGVLGNEASLEEETFECGEAEYPQYTRPRVLRGMKVPDVLFSGDHDKIKKWRRQKKRKLAMEEGNGCD
ncbi:MAG: tRNA (guanosine(37)-N1)-methyltransferase TrmD [Candidatus Aureabacteria bacterium]|nr:tRNA (guanosine(37)-N1)-methyltransferase TrmD [Candidatus Auribacterota bacterium]